ncbi:Uncharacterized protein FKW44_012596, partial [Caligus rogercresseyi]
SVLPLLGPNEPLNYNPRFGSGQASSASKLITSVAEFWQHSEEVYEMNFLTHHRMRILTDTSTRKAIGPPSPFYHAIGGTFSRGVREGIISQKRTSSAGTLVSRRCERLGVENRDLDPRVIMANPLTTQVEKWLRYRVATSSIFTNKSSDSTKCSFCQLEVETSEHLFYNCSF